LALPVRGPALRPYGGLRRKGDGFAVGKAKISLVVVIGALDRARNLGCE
jgi:hypothetical protein